MEPLIPAEVIEKRILLIRGKKVMLDADLAELYGVETKVLKRSVKRNIDRFPEDFLIRITSEEFESLRCHFGTSKRGGVRYLPYAFTENGVAMLSSILNSNKAIQVNIQIMRTFTRLREILSTHEELRRKIELMEKKYDGQFKVVFEAIRQLMTPPAVPKRKIGFNLKEKQAVYGRKGVQRNSRN
jgi:phage regulator Rha-like protein